MNIIVFLGPSLTLAEAKEILGEGKAHYFPPAKQGDILSVATMYEPDVIALIDGEFHQSLAVWHKEILFALEKGITVCGASSMGALRAVETSEFGMIGVGKVYEMYASGEIDDDDEVALLHGPEKTGYRHGSEPMINIRMTFRRAWQEGVVSRSFAEALTEKAKALYYPQRWYQKIFEKAVLEGLPQEEVNKMADFVVENHWDVKAEDAIQLLSLLRDMEMPTAKSESVCLKRSHLFSTLYDMDRSVRDEDKTIPLFQIAHFVALHMPTFHETRFTAINQALVLVLADMLKVDASPEDVKKEIHRFQLRSGFSDHAAFLQWQDDNDLSEEECRQVFYELAICRKMHRWFLTRFHHGRGARAFFDVLRVGNQYKQWKKKAIVYEEIGKYADDDKGINSDVQEIKCLLKEHVEATGCIIDTHITEWAEEAGFLHVMDMLHDLIKAKYVRDAQKDMADTVKQLL